MKTRTPIVKRRLAVLPAAGGALALLVSSGSAGLFGAKADTPEQKRAETRKQRDEILHKPYEAHPDVKEKIEHAVGYGTFNNKNLNLFLLSTGHD